VCLTPAHLQPAYTTPNGAKFIGAPVISAPLEFFDSSGTPIASGRCGDYWKTALPCSAYATLEHLTSCNPALVRATITVRTTALSPHEADTTTRVLIRRGDA
jgi:hypothetical protein